jgi:LysR family transcriptional regulator, benzoate and cis,cis-muconate-responsive activator of ben and cat genes
MEIRHLRAFIAVADAQSIRRAAYQLHVAQSALSRTIHDLERELGLTLFTRTAHGVELTRGGHRFMDGARRTLAEATAAIARARDARESAEGPLVIGLVTLELRQQWTVSALVQYRKEMPHVLVHLESMASIAMVEAVTTGAIDAGIGYAMLLAAAGVTVDALAEDELAGVMVARRHQLARRRRISIFDLAPYDFLWYDRPAHPTVFERIFSAFQQIGFTPHFVPALGGADLDAAIPLVSSCYGWSLLPTTSRPTLPPTLRYLPLSDIAIPLEMQLVTRSDDRSMRMRAFRHILLELRQPHPSLAVRHG